MSGPGRVRRRRRIAVVTGTRAEYGVLRSMLRAINDHSRLELQLIVTGMHLLPKFGETINTIVADGWPIAAKVRMQRGDDEPLDQARGLARGVEGIARALESLQSEVAVVLGDRIEAMAGALAATATGRILAHLHGGDVAVGDLDDRLRHAITKLAHVHFAATQQAARRIVRLGERSRYVFTVGAPGLDELIAQLKNRSGQPTKRSDLALIVQHPVGRSAAQEYKAMTAILNAVQTCGLSPTVIYPNSDRGHQGIITAIEAARRRCDRNSQAIQIERSLPREQFLQLLAQARVLVGNSSCGIIEAASAGTAAVNVGDRQAGRQRSGRSVIDCGESVDAIRQAIVEAMRLRPRLGSRTVYGDGHAGRRITDVLAKIKLDDTLRRKQLTY